TYVALLATEVPGVLDLYHRLCAISHPSNASIEYFYDHAPTPVGEVMLSPMSDSRAISRLHRELPNAPSVALQMNCEPAFLILRVLHSFRVHPQLQVLKKLDWTAIKGWAEIERNLRDPISRFPLTYGSDDSGAW